MLLIYQNSFIAIRYLRTTWSLVTTATSLFLHLVSKSESSDGTLNLLMPLRTLVWIEEKYIMIKIIHFLLLRHKWDIHLMCCSHPCEKVCFNFLPFFISVFDRSKSGMLSTKVEKCSQCSFEVFFSQRLTTSPYVWN